MARTGEKVARSKRGRGRPTTFDRAVAVRAALGCFWRDGFAAVSATELARSMSIRRSSFYNSFGNRERVFLEALELYRASAPDAALASIGPDEDVTPKITAVFRQICRIRAADSDARGCLVVNGIAELVSVHDELGPAISACMDEQQARYEHLLAQAQRRGELDWEGSVRDAAAAFVTFQVGLNTVAKVNRNESALWRMCRDFLGRYGLIT